LFISPFFLSFFPSIHPPTHPSVCLTTCFPALTGDQYFLVDVYIKPM
jgi:hypothetical protein